MNDYLALIAGVLFAGIGGELFVRGAVSLARWARVSPGIVGATVAAFATSSPEFTVSVTAAVSGAPQIALGDALGSNVVNVALILGSALMISEFRAPRDILKRDFPAALSIPVATGVLLFDGLLSRTDGLVLLSLFVLWFVAVVIEARRQRSAQHELVGRPRGWPAAVLCVIGIVLLVSAGRLIVIGATGIAASFGIDQFVIGATIVALGTSVPEIATTVIAKVRGHDEVGLGTILGSNIFNGLFIVGVASSISPISVAPREIAVVLVCGLLAVAFLFPARSGLIERRRGVLLLVLYGIYVVAIIQGQAR